jgi:hypothetical protein
MKQETEDSLLYTKVYEITVGFYQLYPLQWEATTETVMLYRAT